MQSITSTLRKALRHFTGADLRALRKQLGLSVASASRQIAVSERTWKRWEAGTQSIPLGAIEQFVDLNKAGRGLPAALGSRVIKVVVTEQPRKRYVFRAMVSSVAKRLIPIYRAK